MRRGTEKIGRVINPLSGEPSRILDIIAPKRMIVKESLNQIRYRSAVPALRADRFVRTSLPLLGQQLSTIMSHGVLRAQEAKRSITAPRWMATRDPAVRITRLTEPFPHGDSVAVAILAFEDERRPPLLVDAFEAALFEAAEAEVAMPALLRHGFDAEIRTVDAAFRAVRRLVTAGILIEGGQPAA